MTSNRCQNCGTELPPEARFCRLCGQPQALKEGVSVTEATTRVLADPTRNNAHESGARYENGFPPNAYAPLSPDSAAHPATAQIPVAPMTQGLNAPPCRRSAWKWLLFIFAFIVLLGLAMPFALYLFIPHRVVVKKPTVSPPAVPAIPPPAPNPPGSNATSFDALVYPNANVTQRIVHNDKGLLRMESSDPFDKVVQWYEQKLNPENKILNQDKNAILKGDDLTVIINKIGDHTQIMVTGEAGD